MTTHESRAACNDAPPAESGVIASSSIKDGFPSEVTN